MSRDARLTRAMHQHLRLVWRILRRSGLPERDADEAAQDVFLVFHRKSDAVPVPAERSFLVSTALRVASDRRRSLVRRPETELTRDPPDAMTPTDELVALRRARQHLDATLDSLTEEQRAVFVLVEMEQMTNPEAAEVLGVPVGTVASRLRTARQAFDAAVRRLHLKLREGKR